MRNKETLAWCLGEGRGLGRQSQQGDAGEGFVPIPSDQGSPGQGCPLSAQRSQKPTGRQRW